jgi:tetratricopeptide (TPR) repeat protein
MKSSATDALGRSFGVWVAFGVGAAIGVACNRAPDVAPPAASSSPASANAGQVDPPKVTATTAPASASAPGSATPTEMLPEGTPTQLAALNGAKAALAAGRDREALAGFRQAMEGGLSGTSVSAALAVAELLQAKGETESAGALYRDLVVRARYVPEVQYAAGRFFWTSGDAARALQALTTSVSLQPDFLPAWELLGLVQARAGKNTEAGRTLTEYERRLSRLVQRAANSTVTAGDRLAAFEMLSLLSDERALDGLLVGLRDTEPDIRLAVAELLVEEPAPRALEAIARAALEEKHPELRAALTGVLGRARRRAAAETATPVPALPRPESDR